MQTKQVKHMTNAGVALAAFCLYQGLLMVKPLQTCALYTTRYSMRIVLLAERSLVDAIFKKVTGRIMLKRMSLETPLTCI